MEKPRKTVFANGGFSWIFDVYVKLREGLPCHKLHRLWQLFISLWDSLDTGITGPISPGFQLSYLFGVKANANTSILGMIFSGPPNGVVLEKYGVMGDG